MMEVRKVTSLPPVRLRLADEMECRAGGLTSAEAIALSIKASDEAFAVYSKDEFLAIWGYRLNSFMSSSVSLWLLTGPELTAHKTRFARTSVKIVYWFFKHFQRLEVSVHKDYTDSIKWLLWLGFKVESSKDSFLTMVLENL